MQHVMTCGSTAHTTDGKSGSVRCMVMNPDTCRLEYLVVHRGLLSGHDHCVPAEDVRSVDADNVYLSISSDELKALPAFETQLPGGTFQRAVPEHYLALGKNMPVEDANGLLIGHFYGAVIDDNRQMTQVLLDDDARTGIPVERVSFLSEDHLTVQLTEQPVNG